jgi:putative transposase
MLDRKRKLAVMRQAELLDISRSNVYHPARLTRKRDLIPLQRLAELHLNHPFSGAPMLRDMLELERLQVGRIHLVTPMRKMGITAIRKRNTSKPHLAHRIYPYLQKRLAINRPIQEWAVYLPYIPVIRGFIYLVTIIDWPMRRVLAHRSSISMTPGFCVEALEEAIAKYGTPEIFNSDQASQFTSPEFGDVLEEKKIAISMDEGPMGQQRLCRKTLALTDVPNVYLHACKSVGAARTGMSASIEFFNVRRPTRHLEGRRWIRHTFLTTNGKELIETIGLPTSLWPAGKPQLQVLHLQDHKFRPNKSSHLRSSYANLSHPKE